MIMFRYAIRGFLNLITLVIVIGIFLRLKTNFEVIVVSVMGFLYTAIRVNDWRNVNSFVRAGFIIDEQMVRIRELLGDETVHGRDKQIQEEKKQAERVTMLRNIDILFVFLIWCICLYQLLTHVA